MQVSHLWTAVISFAGVAVGIFGVVFSLMIVWVQRQQRSSYDKENQRAVVSQMRDSFEHQLRELNLRLLATEGRFREVNHLLIDGQGDRPISFSGVSVSADRFLNNLGIGPNEREVDPGLVFVLTPFNDDEDETFETIMSVIKQSGLSPVRGDELFTSGDILPHIVKLISSARFIVANISGRNPNVYYELGIAHALGKPTILVSKTLDTVPFDLQSRRIVLFENQSELREQLSLAISRSLANG